VILYELISGRHPFLRRDADEFQIIRAIQYADPASLMEINAQIPNELQSVIFRCLQKTPAERYASAAEVREALKTTMRTLHLDTSLLPADAASTAGMPLQEREKRTTGLLSMLAERFRDSGDAGPKHNTILVLPFSNFGPVEVAPLYGFALADAIAARLARMPSLIVRPSSSLMQLATPVQQMDPLAIGEKLMVQYVLAGNFMRSEQGFDLNWQLLDVPGKACERAEPSACRRWTWLRCRRRFVTRCSERCRGWGSGWWCSLRRRANAQRVRLRWRNSLLKSICRHAQCCRLSCRGQARAQTWTGRCRNLKAWSIAIRTLHWDGVGWELRICNTSGTGLAARCI
jgi:TolB-like protein